MYVAYFVGHAGLTLRSRLQCDFTKRDKGDEAKTGKSRYLVGFSDQRISKEEVGILNYFPSSPSLRRRRNLTSVITFCKAAPVSLLWAHNGLNELSEMLSNSLPFWLRNRQWRF